LPVSVGVPGGLTAPESFALVDSGADRTLVPQGIIAQVQAPEVDRLEFEIGGGGLITLPIYRVTLAVRGFAPLVADVAASDGEEAVLLGRDVLNLYTLTLDGPNRRVGIRDE
jgi:predicted aspartyl protease